ncbi:MAG TPA: DUF4254 domain-containing protein [Verrucomicrobiae bacterium]|jgi:hypothetical protein
MGEPLLNVDAIVQRHAQWTKQWHEATTAPELTAPWNAIESNHRMNFDVWHEEDIARRDDLGHERVYQAKRVIDRCNQARNDAMERIDVWLLGHLPPAPPDAPLHSETPGMMIDRLSVLALRSYHMRLEAERECAGEEHRRKCHDRGRILEEQITDLKRCVEIVLARLQSGELRFKLYKQLKMYNDPSLNPQLRARGTANATSSSKPE